MAYNTNIMIMKLTDCKWKAYTYFLGPSVLILYVATTNQPCKYLWFMATQYFTASTLSYTCSILLCSVFVVCKAGRLLGITSVLSVCLCVLPSNHTPYFQNRATSMEHVFFGALLWKLDIGLQNPKYGLQVVFSNVCIVVLIQ